MEADGPKTKRLNAKPKTVTTTDLIVMNLPFKLEEDAMRAYFETFGEMIMVQLKKDLEGILISQCFARRGCCCLSVGLNPWDACKYIKLCQRGNCCET